MAYCIDFAAPTVPIPCSFVPSIAAPGKTLCLNEDGHAIVVEPDGSQVRSMAPTDPNFDSPWTQGTLSGGYLIYRSSGGPTVPGVPRMYKAIL